MIAATFKLRKHIGMKFAGKVLALVGCLVLGSLLSYAQAIVLQDALTDENAASLNGKRQTARIGKAATVILAVSLKPDYAEAYYKRGCAKIEIGNVLEAKADFRTALKLAKWESDQALKADIEEKLHLLK